MPKGKGYSFRNPPAQLDKLKNGNPKHLAGTKGGKKKGMKKMKKGY